ncbi:MAG: ChaN family lipoprotein [Rubrivivax sp.]
MSNPIPSGHAAAPHTVPRRRALLALPAALLLPACTHGLLRRERIVEVASGRELAPDALLATMRASDFVLLGERHDNPLHHQRRGELIAALGTGAVVVAEQLPRGRQVESGSDLLQRLQAAGFEPKAWQWPQHQGLFQPLLAAGVPLQGGNAPRDEVRKVAREGEAALPADLRGLLDPAPLPDAARQALDDDLVAGHCGQLPAARVPAMRAAQRMRDASLLQAMLDARGRPTVLVAGNGHVRVDHGVPQLLRAARPAARWVAIGFVEGDGPAQGPQPYTHLWVTPALTREDPCAGFRMPAPVQRTV